VAFHGADTDTDIDTDKNTDTVSDSLDTSYFQYARFPREDPVGHKTVAVFGE